MALDARVLHPCMGLVSYHAMSHAPAALPPKPSGPFPAWRFAYAVLVLAGLGLIAAPSLDLLVSGWFHAPGAGFPADHASPYHRAVRVAVRVIAIAYGGVAGIGLVLALARKRRVFGMNAAAYAYLLLLLAVAPGLVVNAVLKNHWDRARPSQIVEFGGQKAFSRAGAISDQCPKNCAFVSGDASIGFLLSALGFVAAAAGRRRPAHAGFAAGALGGAWIGFTRIAQGGHFLSDVVFSGVVVIGIAWLLARALDRVRPRLPNSFRDRLFGDP